jgi:hypothetical protein
MKVLFSGRVIAFILDEQIIKLFAGMPIFQITSDKQFLFLGTQDMKHTFFEVLQSLHVSLLVLPEHLHKNSN